MQQSQTISRISYRKSRVWGSKELPKLPIGEQKRIYVSIKKRNVAGAVLFKDVDDPEAISHFVHYKPGKQNYCFHFYCHHTICCLTV
ncbi:unnamed protein product [Acanthoscelides obtectus]|uniref:Uncharacterized protein n=1 Tax=Acanthoscelides obtectus TaxID=200917 RepID=A0A9P0MEX6_ACAOB|nr:unnamed protein product [Acanthoscelides obtectus]CAK1684783.1 hypothetical protein AOBTE_LOCUS35117 [Acanthoscelides obtectus]